MGEDDAIALVVFGQAGAPLLLRTIASEYLIWAVDPIQQHLVSVTVLLK